jgi:outer membrane cobalamin receptor
MKISGTIWFIVFMLAATISYGQFMPDTVQIQEVNVLAKRRVEEAGLKITRPDSLQKASMITADLSELIATYSPVFIKSYGRGSAATASFRGAAASHTQVYWNGMSLNSPMRGQADLSLVPVFFTDNIFLLHGGSSMTQGSGALGGSIHLENIPSLNTSFGLEGMVESGSFNSNKAFLKLILGKNRFQSSTRLFYEESENNYPFFNTGVIPHKQDTLLNAGYFKTGILQEFYIRHFNDNISGFRLWYQNSERNLPQLMSYQGSMREEFQNDDQLRVQYDLKKYSDGLNYHFFTGLNTTHLNYYRATPAFGFVNQDSESRESGFHNHLRIFRQFDEKTYATVTFNANYFEVKATDNITGNGYRENRLETSLMMNMHLKPSDRLALFILLRSETYDENMVPFIPSAGIEWQVARRFPVIIRSNAARNYNKPSLNDLYWIPGGNPELLPEDGYTTDISLSAVFSGTRLSFSNEITGFLSKIENWITWQPAANGAFFWEADNIRDVLSKGIEYQFSSELAAGRFLFQSGGNYSYTGTSNLNAVHSADESRGKQLIYIPKHKGGIYLSTTWQKFTIKFDVNGVGKRYTKSSNRESDFEQILNPYVLGKLTASKQVSWNDLQLDFKLAIDNLFDQTYQSILWRPMPGRFYSLTAAFKFKSEK